MSEETKVTTNDTAEENKEYRINVTEHEDFDYMTKTKYIGSNELCKQVTDVFKAAFADCYGSRFDLIPGSNMFMITLFFDHDKHFDGEYTAVTKDLEQDNTKNATLRRTRSYGHRLLEGDHYHLTNNGMSALAPFMMDQQQARHIYKNSSKQYGNTEINWDKVVADAADSSYGYNGVARQLTQVSFLDVNKIVELIYGSETEDGKRLQYGVQIVRSAPNFMGGFLLAINCISEENVFDLASKFGIGVQAGLNIIR